MIDKTDFRGRLTIFECSRSRFRDGDHVGLGALHDAKTRSGKTCEECTNNFLRNRPSIMIGWPIGYAGPTFEVTVVSRMNDVKDTTTPGLSRTVARLLRTVSRAVNSMALYNRRQSSHYRMSTELQEV
jgi:hypothetical protein